MAEKKRLYTVPEWQMRLVPAIANYLLVDECVLKHRAVTVGHAITQVYKEHPRFVKMAAIMEAHIPSTSEPLPLLLEIGSWAPYVTSFFKNVSSIAVSLDCKEWFDTETEIGHVQYDVCSSDFVKWLASNRVSAIVCTHCLEHLAFDPLVMLRLFVDALIPGGVLLIDVPIGGNVTACRKRLTKLLATKATNKVTTGHVRVFEEGDIGKLVRQLGITPVHTETYWPKVHGAKKPYCTSQILVGKKS